MKKLTPNEFYDIRNEIYNDLVTNKLLTDKDTNFQKIDFILAQRLSVAWENYDKIKIKAITILWAEGDNSKYDKFPKIYPNYQATNKALKPIYDDITKDGIGGYNKVKFNLLFEDGETYEGKLYISENTDNPYTIDNVIGEHIKQHFKWVIESQKPNEEHIKQINNFLNNYNLDI